MIFIADNITESVNCVKIAQSVKKIMHAVGFSFVPCLCDEPGH